MTWGTNFLARLGRSLIFAGVALWFTTAACSTPPALPSSFEPEAYRPISFEDILTPARLSAGEKVVLPAYFWQELSYDPLMARQYAHLASHPLAWRQLKWYAVYSSPLMQHYFDLVLINRDQVMKVKIRRLDHLRLYGEMASLGGHTLYLRVHSLEKIVED